MIFIATPFGGVKGYVPGLRNVQDSYRQDEAQLSGLEILEPENEFLVDVVENFVKNRPTKAAIACFYSSNDLPQTVSL